MRLAKRCSDICVKQAKILMPQVVSEHTQHTHPFSPVGEQHSTNTGVCTSTDVQAVWLCLVHATKAAWNRALDNPKFPKSQFPRQITSWLPSRNPPLPRTWTAACTAISPAAIQLTIWWEKVRERNIVLKHRMLQLVFCLITEHFWPLPELQSLLELQSLQHWKNKLSLLFVMVRIS